MTQMAERFVHQGSALICAICRWLGSVTSMLARLVLLGMLLSATAQAATISGSVIDDRNGDGALRAEPGLAQVVVYLDEDGDGVLDGDRRCTAAATEPCGLTGGDGLFTISELPPGGYQVRVVVPDGWRLTTPAAVDVLLLDDGAVESEVDFGVFLLGAVQGAVFADANGNAGRDDGEPLLPGWTVFDDVDLDGALERGEPATATAADGAYQLDGLGLGNHAVRLRRRCSFAITLPPPPGRHALSIAGSGQVISGRDFGVRAPVVLPGDGNRDRMVSAADLVAVARAVGTAASPALDANGDGVVNAADVAATAANVFDCAGLAPASPSATPTATATATATPIAATATASVTAPPGSTATNTATRTSTAPATATVPPTASPTASRTPTPSATHTATAVPTATSASGPPPAALAGTAVQLATGMSAIPAVITALVGGIEFGDALVFDPAAQTSGVGGPAGACPLGGSASRSCSAGGGGGTLAIDFDGCRVATASGSVTIDPLPPADPAISLLGGFCIANLPLPPWTATIGLSASFRNPLNMPLLTATADLTGTISPALDLASSCRATGATLALTGTIRSQFADGSAVAVTFADTAVLVTVMQFNADCVPVRYRMTFNGPATLAVESAAGLTSGAAGDDPVDVVFDDFVVEQNASGSPTQTSLSGDVMVPCAAATLGFGTTQTLAQLVGAPCPHAGILRITAGQAVTNVIYQPTFAVGIDVDDDGFTDTQLDSCQEAPPLCGAAPAPTGTATRTRTATATVSTPTVSATPTVTRTPTLGPSPTASATAPSTSTASATPTRTPTVTVSSTRTATPTPSATPTNAAPQEYCDSLPGPALIPDANIPGIDNDIVIGTAETIADLNVALSVAHTWVGDLRVVLTHVNSGSSVVLLDLPGRVDTGSGCGRDDVGAVFDDSAQRPAEERCAEGPPFAAIDGSVAPLGPLSAFNGQSLAGTWRLNVSDRATQDTGALLAWCLQPNSLSPVVRAFTCDDTETECVQVVDEPFSLAFRYADPDGDAATWHLTGRFEDGSEFNAGSGPVNAGSGGLMTLNFDPFTCPTLDCPDTTVDYLLTVRDAAGRESPVQRLRLTVTLFEL